MTRATSAAGIDSEPGSDSAERHHGEQQPADLLELVPFQHPAHRGMRPQPLGRHRQRGQAGGLSALFDRERRDGIRPRRAARPGQQLRVVQQALRIPRRRDGARGKLRSRRRFDGSKIHTASLVSAPPRDHLGRRVASGARQCRSAGPGTRSHGEPRRPTLPGPAPRWPAGIREPAPRALFTIAIPRSSLTASPGRPSGARPAGSTAGPARSGERGCRASLVPVSSGGPGVPAPFRAKGGQDPKLKLSIPGDTRRDTSASTSAHLRRCSPMAIGWA